MASPTSGVNLFELELFVRASRMRSLRELARQSDLRPAHISKVIRRLEEKLGSKLLKRSVSGIVLTREGAEILKTAERICDLASEIDSPRNRTAGAKEKIWSIGSVSFLSSYLVAPVVTVLARDLKTQRFRMVEFTHNHLVSHGLNGAFEIAVHISTLQWTANWQTKSLGQMRWKLYGRSQHPLGPAALPEAVVRFPFVVPTDWSGQDFVTGRDHCPLSVRHRIRGHEAATAETAVEIVRHSEQLTFIPEILGRRYAESGELMEIDVESWPPTEKEIFISVRADLISRSLLSSMTQSMERKLTRK